MPLFSSPQKPIPVIALLTDFGFRDSYVGVMKGVVRGICPEAAVIDLSHNVMPQDVAEAAFVLAASYRYFPEGTIFVCVIDPGVGTDRRVLYMRANSQSFLAPDNGLLSIIAEESQPEVVREVTADGLFLKNASNTFHGRDIFAPIAAHLGSGYEPKALGPVCRNMHSLQLPRPVRCADGSLRGEIVYIDQFGNLITNIRRATIRQSFGPGMGSVQVEVKRRTVDGLSGAYADRPEGELLALVGSSGYLEVAVNRGSAARALGCEKGDTVTLTALEEAHSEA